MQRTEVESRDILSVGQDGDIVEVEFFGSVMVHYLGCPEGTAAAVISAESIELAVRELRDTFEHVRVSECYKCKRNSMEAYSVLGCPCLEAPAPKREGEM